jgi:hypothetical protein
MCSRMQHSTPKSWSSIRTEKLVARPGRRDELIAALHDGASRLQALGCDFRVRVSQEDPDSLWVTQVWAWPQPDRPAAVFPALKLVLPETEPLLIDLDR